jgi:predicted dehydrogenase/threonine dehydrogenase-like Zn-dependent dehydrogenase
MKQLTQKLKDGRLQVLEVPVPALASGMVLVKSHFSVISAGTESSTVTTARMNYLGKAREKPQQLQQVLESLTTKGPLQTYRAVMKKLDAHSPLGYSVAGEVVDVAPDVRGFSRGDLVACGGAGYANHSEYVAVPSNLCVRLPAAADVKAAAYNTVGAIALQGIRQADLRLGETCVVVGLGLLGQLTCLMLRASGIRTVGVDVLPEAVAVARANCVDAAFTTDEPALEQKIEEFTEGLGADAVIITAGTSSDAPINLAGRVARKKGKVVVVGWIGTKFDQDTYYKKELDVRLSCSYGPGRYDINYEERGIDYPAGYVRWTENRNMRAFQEMLHSGKVDLGYVTTHTFTLDEAPDAFEMILKHKEPYLGILIQYDVDRPEPSSSVRICEARRSGKPTIAFIGAGSYAMGNLLPNIKGDAVLKGVMTATGTGSRSVADRYGFEYCTSDEQVIWNDDQIDTIFIATRHDSHADYTLKALRAGRNVFVEKPLCLTADQLEEIATVVGERTSEGTAGALMVGYNRRFSPLTDAMKSAVGEGPMAMIYRVNAGSMPADEWMQQPEIGGGRIIGEACHFIDYLTYVNGSLPVSVYATAMDEPAHLEDTVNVSLAFENGSIGTVSYLANGSTALFKEYIEIHRAGVTGVLTDFRELRIYGSGKPTRKKLLGQNKGQPQMMAKFLDAVREGGPSPIPFDQIYAGMRATFKAVESLRSGEVYRLRG